jgi:hypothetical protein
MAARGNSVAALARKSLRRFETETLRSAMN